MKRLILFILASFAVAASSYALTGNPPGTGFATVDGIWLNGLAGGQNNLYVYGLTAAGTTQATAAQIPAGYYLVEADTVASGTGLYLPNCTAAGVDMLFYNNGANTVTVYPNPVNNPVTGIQDTINNTTSVTITSHNSQSFSCAKAGVWFGK
jgi:hypothetical protein